MLYPAVDIQYDDVNITDSFLQSLKLLITIIFNNLFDLQECLFGCIIFLQSKHIFGYYIRFEGGTAYETRKCNNSSGL